MKSCIVLMICLQSDDSVPLGTAIFAIPPWQLGEGDLQDIFTMDREVNASPLSLCPSTVL